MQHKLTINHRHRKASLEQQGGFSFSTQAFHTDFTDRLFCFDFCSPDFSSYRFYHSSFYSYQFCFSGNGLKSFLLSARFLGGESAFVSGWIGSTVNIDSKGVYRSFSALSEHRLYRVIHPGSPSSSEAFRSEPGNIISDYSILYSDRPIPTAPRLCGKSNSEEFDCLEGQGIINGIFDPTSDLATSANVCTAFGSLLALIYEESILAPVPKHCSVAILPGNSLNRQTLEDKAYSSHRNLDWQSSSSGHSLAFSHSRHFGVSKGSPTKALIVFDSLEFILNAHGVGKDFRKLVVYGTDCFSVKAIRSQNLFRSPSCRPVTDSPKDCCEAN